MWSHLGLNQGPPDYESDALTNCAIGPIRSIPESDCKSNFFFRITKIIFCFLHQVSAFTPQLPPKIR